METGEQTATSSSKPSSSGQSLDPQKLRAGPTAPDNLLL